MQAASEDNNNLVVPSLNTLVPGFVLVNFLYGGYLDISLKYINNCPTYASKQRLRQCTAERNTSFNHIVILLTTLYENQADHAGVSHRFTHQL